MPPSTLSSRELHQDAGKAKRAARKGPVFITDRGREAFVLLNIDEYRQLTGKGKNILELLQMPDDTPDFEFEFPRLELHSKPADFG